MCNKQKALILYSHIQVYIFTIHVHLDPITHLKNSKDSHIPTLNTTLKCIMAIYIFHVYLVILVIINNYISIYLKLNGDNAFGGGMKMV